MNKLTKIIAGGVIAIGATLALAGCVSDSDVASQNLSTEAEQFKIERQIVFYNSITDKYMVTIIGKCSVDDSVDLKNTLAVTCKIGDDKYIKDYLGKSDNVAWFEVQQKPVAVDVYHYKMVFKPQEIIPNLEVETGKNGATGNGEDTGATVNTPTPAPSPSK